MLKITQFSSWKQFTRFFSVIKIYYLKAFLINVYVKHKQCIIINISFHLKKLKQIAFLKQICLFDFEIIMWNPEQHDYHVKTF
jgi:hypothetical protein